MTGGERKGGVNEIELSYGGKGGRGKGEDGG